jgi:hypothetical protein
MCERGHIYEHREKETERYMETDRERDTERGTYMCTQRDRDRQMEGERDTHA